MKPTLYVVHTDYDWPPPTRLPRDVESIREQRRFDPEHMKPLWGPLEDALTDARAGYRELQAQVAPHRLGDLQPSVELKEDRVVLRAEIGSAAHVFPCVTPDYERVRDMILVRDARVAGVFHGIRDVRSPFDLVFVYDSAFGSWDHVVARLPEDFEVTLIIARRPVWTP